MRKPLLLVLIVASVMLVAFGLILLIQDTPPQPPIAMTTPLPGSEVARISVQELDRDLQGNNPPLVWEFVSETQYTNGHLPGAVLMTFDEMPGAAKGLDKQQAIVTLCT
jgi:hypothetical protein